METLQGKVVIVTGGGRGLGEAISRELAEAGAHVVIADIRQELAGAVAGDLRANGHQAEGYAVDLMDEKQIQQMIQAVHEKHQRIDVLINNAAIDKTVSIEELSVDDWDCVSAVNLRAPFLTSKYAFPIMREQGGGHIVNIASTASKRAWANAAVYHATKWGLLGLSHTLHVEGRPHQIKVTAVVSGGMRTPFLLDRFPDIDLQNLQDPRNVAKTVRFVLLQPDETVIPEIMVLPMRETSWP